MIEQNIISAQKILTKIAEEKSWQEITNQESGRLYKSELLITLCGIPGPDLEKLHQEMDEPKKEILQIMLTENPWLTEHRIGTL